MILLDLLLLPAFVPVMAEESDSGGLRSLEKEMVRWIVREDSLAVFVALIRQQEVGCRGGSFANKGSSWWEIWKLWAHVTVIASEASELFFDAV